MSDANGKAKGNGVLAATPASAPIDRLLDKLTRGGYEPEAEGAGKWRSKCPAHQGSSKNLSIKVTEDGTVLLNCHHVAEGRGTCTAADVVGALGLELADLFPPKPEQKGKGKGKPRRKAQASPAAEVVEGPPREEIKAPARNRLPAHSTARKALDWVVKKLGVEPSAWWSYRDRDGSELMRVFRFNTADGKKQFRPVRKDPDGWRNIDLDPPLPIYALDEVDGADVVIVTEGERCADLVAAIGLTSTTSSHGANSAHRSDWSPLRGKRVIILPDNDAEGRAYAQAVAMLLWDLEPRPFIQVLELPLAEEGDDIAEWLEGLPPSWSAELRREELLRLAANVPPWEPPPPPFPAVDDNHGNFSALITREVVRHDGDTVKRTYDVEARLSGGQVGKATVAAEDFESMSWVASQLGLEFMIKPGRNTKELMQHRIRRDSWSRRVPSIHVHTALGWHSIKGRSVYLHAGGGIGADGPVELELEISSDLKRLELPAPSPAKMPEAVSRVLAILDHLGEGASAAAAIVVALPLRAILGPTRSIPHFAGTTGTFKTTTAVLAARFFAPTLEPSDPMTLSWSATAPGMEHVRHQAKDSLVIIDNLIADADPRELAKADWVFNSQGDLTGRGRMRADGSSPPRLDPRGSLISSGECEPRRKSAAGRGLIVEFRPGMVSSPGLYRCHDDAREGWYAQAIACYAMHLASGDRLERYRAELRALAHKHHADAAASCQGCHARHAEAVGDLVAGVELWLRFAVEVKAIAGDLASRFLERIRTALFESLKVQAEIQEETDPAELFLDLLRSMLATNKAVLAGVDGMVPHPDLDPASCGWRRLENSDTRGNTYPTWEQGTAPLVGWVDELWVYLEPNASFSAVERFGRDNGVSVGSKRQVHARLAESGRIRLDESGARRQFTLKAQIGKARPRVIWLDRSLIFEVDPGSRPAEEPGEMRAEAPY